MEPSFHTDTARKLSANLYGIYYCCVLRKTRDDGQRNCPQHVEFHSKNKFEKLLHLLGFIIRHEYVSKAFNLYSTEHKGQYLEPTDQRIGESGNERPQTKANIRNL